MRALIYVFTIGLLGLSFYLAGDEYPIFYVSTQGNDNWSGTLPEPKPDLSDGPFSTFEKARDELRKISMSSGKKGGVILIRGGTYFLKNTLELTESDSGDEDFPVVWKNYKDEVVKIVGGIETEKLENYQGEIYRAKVETIHTEPRVLLYKNRMLISARWPNSIEGNIPGGEWAYITKVPEERQYNAFQCDLLPEFILNVPVNNLEVCIFPNYNWAFQILKVSSLNKETKTIETAEKFNYEAKPGRRFFLQNHLALLDAEWEWYFDNNEKVLYVYLPLHQFDSEYKPMMATLNCLLSIKGAKYINIIGLDFYCSNDLGILIEDSTHCLIAKCSLTGIYKTAISIQGGNSNRVEGCDLFELGGTGINLKGGNKMTLEPGGHQIVNNHIYNFGKIHKTYYPGISIDGVGNRIAHNEIHDAPHIGILLNGNDHIIEYNRIYRVCQETADAGAFYMGRDWTNRGNVLRHNIIHDIYGFGLNVATINDNEFRLEYESPYWAWGIYLDDCSSGVYIYGNILYRVPLCGVMIGGGRDNTIENNIFVDCVPALHIDARWESYCWDVMDQRLEAVKPKEPPYSERYPELLSLYQDDRKKPANNRFIRNVVCYERDDFAGISTMASEKDKAVVYHLDPFDPLTSVFDHNLIYHFGKPIRVYCCSYKKDDCETITFDQWQQREFDNSSIVAQPTFLSPKMDDYWLFIQSVALKELKFQQIPTHRVGCYLSEFRKTWPISKPKPQPLPNRKIWTVTIEENTFKIEEQEFKPLKDEVIKEFDLQKFVEPLLTSPMQGIEQPFGPLPLPENIQPQPPVGMPSFDPLKELPNFNSPPR